MALLWILCGVVCLHQVAAQTRTGMLGLGQSCGENVSSGRYCGHGMICDSVTMTCKGTAMCSEERARIIRETKAGILADATAPSCDKEGNYRGRQCYGGGVIPEIRCQCVDRFTGKRFDQCRQMVFSSYMEAEQSDMNCLCLQREAEFRRENGAFFVGRTFSCNLTTGNYNPVQCTGSVCHCVAPDGTRIGTYQFPIGQSKCGCARDLQECINKRSGQRLPFCDSKGEYHKVLCLGQLCYCVSRGGKLVGEGVSAGTPQHQALYTKC